MPATIANEITLDDFTPTTFVTRTSSRPTRTVVHEILGAAEPYISRQQAGLRSGQHELFFHTYAAALAAESILAQPGAFTLSYPERTAWQMRFAVVGDLELEIAQESPELATIRFSYRELSP
jgi:hypothetical protein